MRPLAERPDILKPLTHAEERELEVFETSRSERQANWPFWITAGVMIALALWAAYMAFTPPSPHG